jgi:hypothetical protein
MRGQLPIWSPRWLGFLFLAVVLHVFSRRVVGWAMAPHLRTELVVDALDMTIYRRKPVNVIHHFDRGCQYMSIAFGKRCEEAGVRPSLGSVGDCYEMQCAGVSMQPSNASYSFDIGSRIGKKHQSRSSTSSRVLRHASAPQRDRLDLAGRVRTANRSSCVMSGLSGNDLACPMPLVELLEERAHPS